MGNQIRFGRWTGAILVVLMLSVVPFTTVSVASKTKEIVIDVAPNVKISKIYLPSFKRALSCDRVNGTLKVILKELMKGLNRKGSLDAKDIKEILENLPISNLKVKGIHVRGPGVLNAGGAGAAYGCLIPPICFIWWIMLWPTYVGPMTFAVWGADEYGGCEAFCDVASIPPLHLSHCPHYGIAFFSPLAIAGFAFGLCGGTVGGGVTGLFMLTIVVEVEE